MNLINNSVVSKVKDGLIVSLSVAVLFVAGISGNFAKPTASDSFPSFRAHQLEGSGNHFELLPIGDNGDFDGD